MIFIIGGKGLTGSALVRYAEEKNIEIKIIQKENKNEFIGRSCDILIFANGNALKYKANEDALFDFNASLSSLAEYIHGIKFKKFVHLSTVDVYDKKTSNETTKEDAIIDPSLLDVYGYHKLLAENYVKHFCDDYLIFRLSGLVGIGTRKNPAYDFCKQGKKVMTSSNSTMNFINTSLVAKAIFSILDLKISNQIFNLASKNSIKIGDIKKVVGFDSEYTEDAEHHIQNYMINSEKIQEYVEMSTSEEAIDEYFKSLRE